MATRTEKTNNVCFSLPFFLPGLDAADPAGTYRVNHDEKSIDGVALRKWRRVRSFIRLPATGVRSPLFPMIPIDPADLNAAIEKDHNS